jgi:hypothetical protein
MVVLAMHAFGLWVVVALEVSTAFSYVWYSVKAGAFDYWVNVK